MQIASSAARIRRCGPAFTLREREVILAALGISHVKTVAGMPWLRGKIERFLRTAATGLIAEFVTTCPEHNLRLVYRTREQGDPGHPYTLVPELNDLPDTWMTIAECRTLLRTLIAG